ncbi:hypothetical protein Ancab_024244 [Ancistrocladus abbreviatus]
MAGEGMLSFSVASMVEDVLKQHGSRLSDIDLASRKAEEASLRRYEAAGWLRKMVGVVAAKDLPAEPSEEDFRIGLRSGIILCNVLNKIQPGAVPKVVEAPNDTVLIPDGAALIAFQYFENVRNFLVAIEDMGLPTFEACDFEQGGKTARIVNCVLAMKSYGEWKQGGGSGSWKFSGNLKQPTNGNEKQPSNGKTFLRKNSEPFMTSISRNSSVSEKSFEAVTSNGDIGTDFNNMSNAHSLSLLVRSLLSDKKPEEVPTIVVSMLSKVMEEFEHRLANQDESVKTATSHMPVSSPSRSLAEASSEEIQKPNESETPMEGEQDIDEPCVYNKGSQIHVNEHQKLSEKQQSEWRLPEQWQSEGTLSEEQQNEWGLTEQQQSEESLLGQQSAQQRLLVQQQREQRLLEEQQNEKRLLEQQQKERRLLEQQQRDIQVLKYSINIAKESLQHLQMTYQEELNNLGKHLYTLAHAASGYRKVLEENRKLYNQVQDLKGNIRVYCRVRPFLPGQPSYSSSVDHIEEGNITVLVPSKYVKDGKKSFTFNKAFGPSATQEIRNSSQNGINVPDANRLPVSSTTDVISLMNLGHRNRAVCATAMNERSSRSHSCLTVHVQGKDLTSGAVLRGCMHLVDLAGSERVDKSGVTGDGLKEAQNINKSLSALGDVIASLAQKNTHVPYRNSKLTQLLQDALGGQAKTLMFVHISPEPDAIGETLSTLKFAERVSTVELGAARANKDTGDFKAAALKEQIASLKVALAKKDEEMEQLSSSILSSSPESIRMKSAASSPSHSQWRAAKDSSSGRRNPMEDVGNVKVKKNSLLKPRRRSLDPQDLLTNSPRWPLNNDKKQDAKDIGSCDWINKAIVNEDALDRRSSYGSVDEDSQKIYYQGFQPYDSFKHPSDGFESNKKDSQDPDVLRSGNEPSPADDLDELDVATSDSSELDFQVPISLPRVSSTPNGLGSKTRKPQAKSAKSSEIRTSIPAPPSRKISNGSVKSVRQVAQVKRKTTNIR